MAKLNIHGSKIMLYIWWDQLGVVYYELLKPTETIKHRRSVSNAIDAFESKDKRPQYTIK